MNNTYFIADAHLGSWAIKDTRDKERHLVAFLDTIKDDAKALYILGDMFDFWYEYRYTVPRGYTRFLGKLSELTDRGVEVHFLVGNHDQWMMHDYLHKECGVTVHTDKLLPITIGKKHFCLAHGDGLDNKDKKYLILRSIFHNKVCQRLFSAIHPRWAMKFGYVWARHSRLKHEGKEGIALPEDKDRTLAFARRYVEEYPEIDYFIIGHRHVDQQNELPNDGIFIVLGDWITKFTYAKFDGNNITVNHFNP
ncbi:MAG: UDP-2,3-diacylglucosamine diphosphatase [Bacteroidaceae bacterium]|nr:UDP-2,3-diacylglucosamine diphosphatase [Bacteroidaceae bacterium]MBP5731146.1 UDP-2,3-diacylglucosamine diphosphatase [Bacteroidaceae bacterium]